MKKFAKKISSLMLVFAMVFTYVPSVLAEDSQDAYEGWDTIKVFETTDVHGYITDVSTYKEETFQYRLAYLANIVNAARADAAYQDVLLLDAGDIYQSTPHSNLTYGAALRAAYDKMGYDAVALGNHEFDWDVTTYAADAKGTMAPYEIGDYAGDPDIPVLMSNLYYAGTTDRVNFTQDYTVVEKAGYKIAILGWSEDYSKDIKASQIEPYTIDDDIEKLKEEAEEVKEETDADVLVVLTHSAPDSIAAQMDPEVVDLVAGGHTHRNTNGTAENGIDYIQGNYNAFGYATAEIKIDPETKEVDVVSPEYKEIAPKGADLSYLFYQDGANEALDPEITKVSQAAWDAVKDGMYEVLCTVDQSITKNFLAEDTTSTIAGNWLAGLMLDATKEQKTIAAFTNRGGIRTNILLEDGAKTRDVTVADIYTITPFSNRILAFEITGKQMAQQLENALIGLNPAIGIDTNEGYQASNFGDQFAGIRMTYKLTDEGIKVTSITTDAGESIDINDTTKTYPVCVNEYCATLAGSVFKELTPLVAYDDAPVDNLSAIAALQERREAEGLEMKLDTSIRTQLDKEEEKPGTENPDKEEPGKEEPGKQEPGKGNSDKTNNTDKKAPGTGDGTMTVEWMILLTVAGAAIVGAVESKKRRQQK